MLIVGLANWFLFNTIHGCNVLCSHSPRWAAQKDLKNKRVWFAIRNLDSAATLHMTQI